MIKEMTFRKKLFLDVSGVRFSLAFLSLVEYLLYRLNGVSFFALAQAGSVIPTLVFVCGMILGMACEYIGQFAIDWWYYPSIKVKRSLLLLLPIFWGIFIFIMQDMYAIFRIWGLDSIPAVAISPFITACLIEGVNLYTKTWIYRGKGSHPLVLAFGWGVLLSFFFVTAFNAYIINPFGF